MRQTFNGRVHQVAGGDIANFEVRDSVDRATLLARRDELYQRYRRIGRDMWANPYLATVIIIVGGLITALWFLVSGRTFPYLTYEVLLGAGTALVMAQAMQQLRHRKLARVRADLAALIRAIDAKLIVS